MKSIILFKHTQIKPLTPNSINISFYVVLYIEKGNYFLIPTVVIWPEGER